MLKKTSRLLAASLLLFAHPAFAQAQTPVSNFEFDAPSCRMERDAALDATIAAYGEARLPFYLPKNIQANDTPAEYERQRAEAEARTTEHAEALQSRMRAGAPLCRVLLADLRCLPGEDNFQVLADLLARFCAAEFDAIDAPLLREPSGLSDQQLRSWRAVRWVWFQRQ